MWLLKYLINFQKNKAEVATSSLKKLFRKEFLIFIENVALMPTYVKWFLGYKRLPVNGFGKC